MASKGTQDIFQNFLFRVPQEQQQHSGLEGHEGE